MLALAKTLVEYIELHFAAALERDPSGPARPVLVGPPAEALRGVFNLLTANGRGDWNLPAHEVVVLLVDEGAPPAGSGLSRSCNWDYAVTIRNSRPLVLILAARASWDNRPESLANTTETLGGVSSEDGDLGRYLCTVIASKLNIRERDVQGLLRLVRLESSKLEPRIRNSFSWEVYDRLLASAPTSNPSDAACVAAGIPLIGTSGKSFRQAYELLDELAGFVSTVGLSEAVDQMQNTNAAQSRGIGQSIDEMQQHLAPQLPSPTAFETVPLRQFRVGTPTPAWYQALDAAALEDILTELNRKSPQGRLNVTCTNGLPNARPLPGGPYVVTSATDLEVAASPRVLPVVTFSRKIDRSGAVAIPALQIDPMKCSDSAAPAHLKPIKYKADAPQFRAGTVDVVSLDTFACGGLAVVKDADKNGTPVFASRARNWTQEVSLSRGGSTEILIFHGPLVAEVAIARLGEPMATTATVPGSHFVSSIQDVEDNDAFAIQLNDSAGAIIGSWTLHVLVKSSVETVESRLESLIAQHRTGRKSVPHASDTLLNRLELGSYLPHADSWKPVLACWTSKISTRLSIDWNNEPVLGDLKPQIDPRPSISPPVELLRAREGVRSLLEQEQRSISEIEINKAPIAAAVEEYLSKYFEWLGVDPQSACWLDTMAIHAAEWNSQAGTHVATDEPVVILLSPLHPLRLGWHAVSQEYLSDALQKKLCPAAGLLSPSFCPDAGLLFIRDGQSLKPRAFFALPSQHPHWVVMANVSYLDKPATRAAVLQRTAELGLMVEGITGGFTAQQTQNSLDEVTRLLPARATLRVGIVGDPEGSSECGSGVFHWTESQQTGSSDHHAGPFDVEIFDARDAADPSPEQLADLSERTSEHVRWFKLEQSASLPKLDLTIIDQLGARSPEAAIGATRSAVTPACLFRTRIREDFQNARAIMESRVLSARVSGNTLADRVTSAVGAYESLALRDASRSHFRFTPNQDAVGVRLQNSIFLSVTSSQIDPACIVRGTAGQGGYLWDYELPGVLSGTKTSLGYYLVAQPTSAMAKAVENAALLLASSSPDVPGLLEEVSRRGIPILKRLASGGSQSRGELGLLLATRLLQDCFRPGSMRPRLPVHSGNCIHFVLPVDPYEELFSRLRRSLLSSTSEQRPDLIVVAIRIENGDEPVSIKLTPVEVKYRAGGMSAADMRAALLQSNNLGLLLSELWVSAASSDLWKTCGAALLAQFIDFGFRVYAAEWLHRRPDSEWAVTHQRVLCDILESKAQVTVNTAGRLLVFGGSGNTLLADLDGDGRLDTIHISTEDARSLLEGRLPISAAADGSVPQLDFSFPDCGQSSELVAAAAAAAEPSVPVQAEPTPADSANEHEESEGAQPEAGNPSSAARANVSSPVTPQIRQQVQNAFEGFIANESAVAMLSNDLLRALIENPPHLAKNYLFTGLPSTGKTELARRIALALGLPFVKLDGRSVASRDKLFELINGELRTAGLAPSQVGQQLGLPVMEYPPLIVFVDEVHLVPRALQEALLTMLEAADRTVVLSGQVARMHRATFLFATTRASDVDAAFISRCEEIQLREYTEEEVAHILRWKLPHDDWNGEVYLTLAKIGRCVPRISIQLAGALETAVLVSDQEKSVLAHLQEVRRVRGIDEKGLTRMDFEYLNILERAPGPVGEQNILNLMRTVDKDRVLNEIEPFLVRLDFVRRGARGRELTAAGKEYVLSQRLHGAGQA
ncbi:Holliday junction DNA helicase RuvB C-terminal domain-containing protein [Bradyrhizobium sp. 613_E4_N2_2]|uniref:Holliday junction DNA helicase RuvB C-terminal domain-containing protein n=1 Tax=Bradyrhizobium sp. 613_E4_N2_2 TaxID=3240371 RepID=UPI003F8CDB74